MGLATFVFKMQLQSNEQLAISFKNLTANAEFKYLLSDENLSTSDTIVDKTNNSGVDLTSNLIIKNISNKKYLYIENAKQNEFVMDAQFWKFPQIEIWDLN